MTVSYSNALKAFQNGKGTPVHTQPEHTRIILAIPEIDAPPILMPKEGAPQNGIVTRENLSESQMQSRHGFITGNGLVFRNIAENNGMGIWQSVHTNGNGVIIFNKASPAQFEQMKQYAATCLKRDGEKLSLESLGHILAFATEIGLTDRYNSTKPEIAQNYENTIFSDASPLSMPVKKSQHTRAMFVPAGEPLEWDPKGEVMETYQDGSFLIVSKEHNGTATELRHLNPDDAEKKYYIENGDAVKLTNTAHPNVRVFSQRVAAHERKSCLPLQPLM